MFCYIWPKIWGNWYPVTHQFHLPDNQIWRILRIFVAWAEGWLDCNIQSIRFLPRGKFYPLPCGLVGRALGTTVFVKIQTALGSIPPGVTKKFLEWNWKTVCREWPVASSAPRVSRLNDSRLTNLTIDFSTKHDFQTFASRNRPNSSNSWFKPRKCRMAETRHVGKSKATRLQHTGYQVPSSRKILPVAMWSSW